MVFRCDEAGHRISQEQLQLQPYRVTAQVRDVPRRPEGPVGRASRRAKVGGPGQSPAGGGLRSRRQSPPGPGVLGQLSLRARRRPQARLQGLPRQRGCRALRGRGQGLQEGRVHGKAHRERAALPDRRNRRGGDRRGGRPGGALPVPVERPLLRGRLSAGPTRRLHDGPSGHPLRRRGGRPRGQETPLDFRERGPSTAQEDCKRHKGLSWSVHFDALYMLVFTD